MSSERVVAARREEEIQRKAMEKDLISAQKELEKLKQLLKKHGIDPNEQ